MKGHKEYHHRKTGGKVDSPMMGRDEAVMDLMDKPNRRNNAPKIEDAGEAMHAKRGGKVKKAVGKAEGAMARKHGGRTARKSGGSVESNPFSAARHGESPTGRKLEANEC